MNSEIQNKYDEWCQKVQDQELSEELNQIKNNPKLLENKFYKDLQFGTGGLRGEIGVGTNNLNIYTVGRATQGLADYVKSIGGTSAAISYDSRNKSIEFAKRAASVLARNGIVVYIVKELMPTPFLSFATRYYHTAVGIMITASHNPARYNGYKVYGSDGCQITDCAAAIITDFIEKADYFSVPISDFEESLSNGMIRYMEDETEELFLQAVEHCGVCDAENLKITYTPLNGTGYRIVPKMLQRIGINDVNLVKEQSYPDGNFPTCPYPNPEKKEALELGMKYAAESNSDLLMATDPDADRVGIAVKTDSGYRRMSGNEVGVLLMDFLLMIRRKNGTLPENALVVKTIVTTKLAEKIAKKFNVKLINVLTGFKYIGEQITKLEQESKENTFVLGFEESYGYLAGSYVRDKDAVIAVMLIAQMASYYKKQGKTLLDRMEELYAEYGTYTHKLLNFEFPGASGAKKMQGYLEKLRMSVPTEIAGDPVEQYTDYLTQTEFDLPKANVLQFDLASGAQVIIRPSGTEPQIKVYLTATQTEKENQRKISEFEATIRSFFV